MPVSLIIILITAAVVIAALITGAVIAAKSFRPNPDKRSQLRRLNKELAPAGFAYDAKGDCFYSLKDCWQREAGYCSLYDEGAPYFNMIADCEPVTFSYGGKRWLIELWKGQYGICTGAEIGVYNTSSEDIYTEKFTGTFYEPINDSEQLKMAFTLYRDGKPLISRRGLHWWLTGFKLGRFSEKSSLTMEASVSFPHRDMLYAFTEGLAKLGYTGDEYKVRFNTVYISYTKPHSKQPKAAEGVSEDAVQLINKSNCRLYNTVTADYAYTPDKLEYLKSFAPGLYEIIFKSLYGKAFYKKFEWLLNLLDRRPKPPSPPKPCKPCKPCEPCEPCKPDKPHEPCKSGSSASDNE